MKENIRVDQRLNCLIDSLKNISEQHPVYAEYLTKSFAIKVDENEIIHNEELDVPDSISEWAILNVLRVSHTFLFRTGINR